MKSYWGDYRAQLLRANTLRRCLQEERAARESAEKWARKYARLWILFMILAAALVVAIAMHMEVAHRAP